MIKGTFPKVRRDPLIDEMLDDPDNRRVIFSKDGGIITSKAGHKFTVSNKRPDNRRDKMT